MAAPMQGLENVGPGYPQAVDSVAGAACSKIVGRKYLNTKNIKRTVASCKTKSCPCPVTPFALVALPALVLAVVGFALDEVIGRGRGRTF